MHLMFFNYSSVIIPQAFQIWEGSSNWWRSFKIILVQCLVPSYVVVLLRNHRGSVIAEARVLRGTDHRLVLSVWELLHLALFSLVHIIIIILEHVEGYWGWILGSNLRLRKKGIVIACANSHYWVISSSEIHLAGGGIVVGGNLIHFVFFWLHHH